MMLPIALVADTPATLRAEYEQDVARALRPTVPEAVVGTEDLGHLPLLVQRYLRLAGVVGKPRVSNFRVRMHGRIRSGPSTRWMPLTAEQHNTVHPPARLFHLRSAMWGLPVQGYHRFIGTEATMEIRAAGLVPIERAAGKEMNRSETVTLFNDMCVMAPATLIDPAIGWEVLDASSVRATFHHAKHTIHATLVFSESGELVNVISDDRYQLSPDARSARNVRWSTPITSYREFGTFHLPSTGEGRWHERDGEYTYIQLTIDEVEYNVVRLRPEALAARPVFIV